MKYAMLNVCTWYSNLSINQLEIVAGKVDDTILHFTSLYYSCFSEKYSSKVNIIMMWWFLLIIGYRLLNIRNSYVCTNLPPDPTTIIGEIMKYF